MESQYEIINPSPSSLVASLRSIGYSLETAVADLIDNSITANAKNVDIDSPFEGVNTKIFIMDDGEGMTEQTLVEAMRLGSSSPYKERSRRDLGRFGLGLKTATFSQCKKLTVISKHRGIISARCWDLDMIVEQDKWLLSKDVPQEYIERLSSKESGTLVIWEHLDRIISLKDKRAESNFNNKKGLLRKHLSLTFHRFIENGSLSIKVGGTPITPWNPFLPSAQDGYKKELPTSSECNGKVQIHGMVMPHRSYFSDAEYREAGFGKGWTQMQGFYIYRGDRLLTAGGWLGLKSDGSSMLQEHHYDLARICVDISNDSDFDWDIDIKKSKAIPPDYLREPLSIIAKKIRSMAYETYSYRGTQKTKKSRNGVSLIPLWNSVSERNGKLFYSINKDYPLIQDILSALEPEMARKLICLLKLIAETLPVESIGFEASKSNSKRMSRPYETEQDELAEIRKTLIASFIIKGMSEFEAKEQVDLLLDI